MRLALAALLSLALAAALGLGATWWTVTNGLPDSGLAFGPWRAEPGVGTLDADPYQRAGAARRGEAPLAYGDGLAFAASTDDEGRPLDAACDYELAGDLPSARLWTLSLFTPAGKRLGTAADRVGFASSDALRTVGQPLDIALSREARPGNWAPIVGEGPFVMRFALYDTTLGTPLDRSDRSKLLSIRRGACR
jgi:hypothetical protein